MTPIYTQIILTLTLMILFFAFYFKFGLQISRIIRRRVCPVCFAVGSTWLSLLIIYFSGIYEINRLLIAMLLSESVVGVSYLTEEFLLVYNLKFDEYLLKFGIILYGTASLLIFAFIHQPIGFLLFLPVIIFGFFSLSPIKKRG